MLTLSATKNMLTQYSSIHATKAQEESATFEPKLGTSRRRKSSSRPTGGRGRSSQKKLSTRKVEVEWLAAETFRLLSPFVDPAGWGTLRQDFGDNVPRPKPVITKQIKRALLEWQQTAINPQTGYRFPILLRDESGQPTTERFSYFCHYSARLWSPTNIQKCFDGNQPMYYTSSQSRLRMAYLDGDAHHAWQSTPEIVGLFQQLFRSIPFYRSSPRGYNGWIKVICLDSAEWNLSLERLQKALKKLRYQYRCTCDVEIMGGTNTSNKNADLAKLPCWNWMYPCLKHDDDDCWNIRRMQEFEAKPILTWPQWNCLINRIEAEVDENEVAAGFEIIEGMRTKADAAKAASQAKVYRRKVGVIRSDVGASPASRSSSPTRSGNRLTAVSSESSRACRTSFTTKECPEAIRQIDDAWDRDLQFTLWLSRQMKRLPTLDEVLEADRHHGIFRGGWEDGLGERRRRYESHIEFVGRTFDPSKCGTGTSERRQLDQKMREWRGRAILLPKEMVSTTGCTKTLDGSLEPVLLKGRRVHIQRDHVLRLAGIIEHVSSTHADGGIPRDSIEGWWSELAEEGILPRWSKDYYYACRRVLVQKGWVKLNHHYIQGVSSKTARIKYDPDLCGTVWTYPGEEESLFSHTLLCNSGVARQQAFFGRKGQEVGQRPGRGPP